MDNKSINNIKDKKISILGSTGSIGTQSLDVCDFHGISVEALSVQSNIKLLEEQARKFGISYAAVADEEKAGELKKNLADTDVKVFAGSRGILEMINELKGDTVINSIIGGAGLLPTMEAIKCGKNVALANKETLVTAGEIVMRSAKEKGISLLPIDSEHCAIFQCLMNGRREEVAKLILTASGGPFFGMTRDELKNVTVEQALAHPTWKMGRKITIDSATLMNKCFEMIEAAYLFDMPESMIDVVVHRESIVHSMVEYIDGAIIAQMSLPDMRMCIRYAVSYPFRVQGNCRHTDMASVGKLTFAKPDYDTFEALKLAPYALSKGGVIPAVLNGANEMAVELFLNKKISFTDITDLVSGVVHNYSNIENPTLDDIIEAGEKAKRAVYDAAS